jgi:hypothetical protein
MVGVFGFYVRQTLPKGQDIGKAFSPSKRVDDDFGVLHVFEPLLLRPGNPQNLALDYDPRTINVDIRANALHFRIDGWCAF